LAGLGVVRLEIAAHGKLRAGDSNNHFAFRDTGSHGEGIAVLRVGYAGFPYRLPGFAVQGYQPSIIRGSDDIAVVYRNSAIHDAATHLGPHGSLVHFRIPSPLFFTGARVDGIHDAPVGDAVESTVRHQ